LLEFSPQSLGAVARIPVSIPVVLVEFAGHLLQIRLRQSRVDRGGLDVGVPEVVNVVAWLLTAGVPAASDAATEAEL
jgi:hypothetical protein